jgi:hypothetical protein
MSMNQLPQGGGGAVPGSPSINSGAAQQRMDLMRILGQSFVEYGTELAKGPQGDPVKVARAHAKITQAGAMLKGVQQPQQQQYGQRPGYAAGGKPQPADRAVDALTQQPPADKSKTGQNIFTS